MNSISPSVSSKLAIHGGNPARPQPIKTTVSVSQHARDSVAGLLESGELSLYYNGPVARQFEHEFARYFGDDLHAVAVNSGTSALHLAVTAAGVGPGDEVIVPALCFVAAASAVTQNGGIPVICDAKPEKLTLDLNHAERLISPRTKAILPVHFWGYPSDGHALRELCDHHGLQLIEDCAQALGAVAHGARVGTFGDYATFAFSVRKHIACGEGGAVLCRDETTHERLRSLSNYGKGAGWDDYVQPGFSYRLAEIPAVVALDGLSNIDDEVAARRDAAGYYAELFQGTGLTVVPEPEWGTSSFFKCPVLLPPDHAVKRSQIVEAISAENVSCRIPHRPLYRVPWLADQLRQKGIPCGAGECPVAESFHARLIEIETGPHVSAEDAEITGAAVMKVWNHFSK